MMIISSDLSNQCEYMKRNPLKIYIRALRSHLRCKSKADILHESFDDANQWNVRTKAKYYYFFIRKSDAKSNLNHNGTKTRYNIRKLRYLKN